MRGSVKHTMFVHVHPRLPICTRVCLIFLDYTINYLSASKSAYLTDLSHSLDAYLAFRLEFILKYSKVFLCTVTLLRLTLVMYLSVGNSPPVSATVLVVVSHPICGSCKFEFLAKQPKSKKESGEKMPILRFSFFRHLFQFLTAL